MTGSIEKLALIVFEQVHHSVLSKIDKFDVWKKHEIKTALIYDHSTNYIDNVQSITSMISTAILKCFGSLNQ